MQCTDCVVGDSCDGEEILYHPAEPVGILLGAFEQFSLLLSGQILFIVQDGGDGTADSGEGRSQIVGHPSQEIRPKLFPLVFQTEFFLLLDTGHQCGNHHADRQHGHERQRITVGGKVNLHIRRGKRIVYCDDAGQRCKDSVEITLRQQ